MAPQPDSTGAINDANKQSRTVTGDQAFDKSDDMSPRRSSRRLGKRLGTSDMRKGATPSMKKRGPWDMTCSCAAKKQGTSSVLQPTDNCANPSSSDADGVEQSDISDRRTQKLADGENRADSEKQSEGACQSFPHGETRCGGSCMRARVVDVVSLAKCENAPTFVGPYLAGFMNHMLCPYEHCDVQEKLRFHIGVVRDGMVFLTKDATTPGVSKPLPRLMTHDGKIKKPTDRDVLHVYPPLCERAGRAIAKVRRDKVMRERRKAAIMKWTKEQTISNEGQAQPSVTAKSRQEQSVFLRKNISAKHRRT